MTHKRPVAVITGAASGIGLALSKTCLHRGYDVVMADNAVTALCDAVEALSSDAKTSEVMGVVCDVSNPSRAMELAQKTFERFGRVDWLVNNAGVSGELAPVWEQDISSLKRVMDINLFGALHCIQAFIPKLFEQTHASRIINMASLYGLCSGSNVASYAMSKHALIALSESLHFDLRRHEKNVKVSVVCPSFVNTAFLKQSPDADPVQSVMADWLTRARSADEVAEHIVKAAENNVFYILPDREVKQYCEERSKAIVEQTEPHVHSLEKVVDALARRARRQELA
ncbi:oxidoreductase dehydrogenase, short chain [Legionella geestiana]|uniref:Oxidoreductase dehydrogenase, short chain n=1 Tax=Legionella geestiana TaxID=45065 RepID=A0A0W0U999_9GAMM|nr:SDR family NAD(P)-dependent oxidoreductase [Legionella geestiana]KTD04215.1 oxidoreductase dehydrogenase, short chain [Legionella geestiana]QBS11638.1 SDR family NAD(P)-dependent oxidoreductase [Legionella geestiana]QDQ40752.1 SDR family NAD(P)-dependent oxidoreductase [Legionella geestiana]STX53680.1 oxidoreductase dehydrogenase, short chain [Legionella geestiana]